MPLFTFQDFQYLQQQQQRHEKETESPWSILDPSLTKKSTFCFPSAVPSVTTKRTYLDFTIINYHQQELIQQEEEKEEEEEEKKEENLRLQYCLKEIEEIETELSFHRNSIYSEKLKVLQNELLSIEKDTHKYILNQDKNFAVKRDLEISQQESMYHYQLATIDKQVQHEENKIYQEIEAQAGFARRVLTSEDTKSLVELNHHHASSNSNNSSNSSSSITKRKRKEQASSSPPLQQDISDDDNDDDNDDDDDDEEQHFKKIHLQKKIGKLQAIHDRQRAVKEKNQIKKNTEDVLLNKNNQNEQDELENDLNLMKKNLSSSAITNNKKL